MNSQDRNRAKQQIREFFDSKRTELFEIEFPAIKRRFLGELNSLAKEMEFLASDLADKGKGVEETLKKSEEKFKKLIKQFLKDIPDDPIIGIPYKKIREILKELLA